MKKTFYLFPILILCLGLFAGCGNDKKPGPDDSGKGDTSKVYTISVTPPEDWTAVTDNYTMIRYRADSGSGDFWVKQGVSGSSVESDIGYYKERENESDYDITWEDVKDEKVNGMGAKYLKYTINSGSLKIRYDVYFIKKDTALFTVICMTSPDSDYSEVESGYKALLNSLVIAEK